MLRNNIHVGKRGFISGLAKDESGNVIMIMAAAIIPLLAITGGAIDSSRAYMVKERLQAACDAGVLSGRKAMTTKTFDDASKLRAQKMFKFNYQDGMMDTTNIAFTPIGMKETLPGATVQTDSGEVSATASANMPTTLMRIFSTNNINMSVTCNADFQVPNIDIMMVLDTTASMAKCPDNSTPVGTSATPCPSIINGVSVPSSQATKIVALRKAVKDFYATMKIATQANSKTNVRYGFVPYANTVNGRNLNGRAWGGSEGNFPAGSLFSPNADSSQISTNIFPTTQVPYESKVAVFNVPVEENVDQTSTTVSYETYNKDGPTIVTSTFPSAPPAGGTAISYDDCTGNLQNSTTGYSRNKGFTVDDGYTPQPSFTPTLSGNPIYQVGNILSTTQPSARPYTKITYERSDYDNQWTGENFTNNTFDKYKVCTRKVTVENYTTEKRIVGYGFSKWIYKTVLFDLTEYNKGNAINYTSAFNRDTATVRVSGEYDPVRLLTELKVSAPSSLVGTQNTMRWDGCTEEPETVAETSFSPDIPAGALDLNYNSFPSDKSKTLRPILQKLYFSRPSTATVEQGPQTAGNIETTLSASNGVTELWGDCTSASMRNLTDMSETDVSNYVNTLWPSAATYHDIGMVWGLRLLSKNGMFADRNRVSTNGGQIDRNIVFMTDGQLEVSSYYNAWGVEKTNRRITGTNALSEEANLHSKRFRALCEAAKFKEGITISVIAFGTALSDNLKDCASDGRAYHASDVSQLDAAFKKIATSIADLRLTR